MLVGVFLRFPEEGITEHDNGTGLKDGGKGSKERNLAFVAVHISEVLVRFLLIRDVIIGDVWNRRREGRG